MSLESFKAGFIRRCKEAGISEKQAMEGWPDMSILKAPFNAVKNTVESVGPLAYFGVPLAAGAGAGYAGAKMQELDEDDVDDVRKREMINNYKQLANEMDIRRKARPQIPTRARYPIVR